MKIRKSYLYKGQYLELNQKSIYITVQNVWTMVSILELIFHHRLLTVL